MCGESSQRRVRCVLAVANTLFLCVGLAVLGVAVGCLINATFTLTVYVVGAIGAYYVVVGTLGLHALVKRPRTLARIVAYAVCFGALFILQLVFVGFYFTWRSQMRTWLDALQKSVDESSGDVFGQVVYAVYNNTSYFVAASVVVCVVEVVAVVVLCVYRRTVVAPTPQVVPADPALANPLLHALGAAGAAEGAAAGVDGAVNFEPWRPLSPAAAQQQQQRGAVVGRALLRGNSPRGSAASARTPLLGSGGSGGMSDSLRQSLVYHSSPPIVLATAVAQPPVLSLDGGAGLGSSSAAGVGYGAVAGTPSSRSASMRPSASASASAAGAGAGAVRLDIDAKTASPAATTGNTTTATTTTTTTTTTTSCVRCGKRAADAVHVPCGHSSMCWACATKRAAKTAPAPGASAAAAAAAGSGSASAAAGVAATCTTCGAHSTLLQLKFDKVCDVCMESKTGADVFGLGACGHLMCVACAVGLVKDALGDAAGKFPVRCPTLVSPNTGGNGKAGSGSRMPVRCASVLKEEQIRHLAAQARTAGLAGTEGLSRATLKQFLRLNLQASIPAAVRVYCPNAHCGGISVRPTAEQLRALGGHPAVGVCVRCSYCAHDFCLPCLVPWHAGKTCAQSRREHKGVDTATLGYIRATTKPCPRCGVGMTHYKGHYCHHIAPGEPGGCRNCRTHFCFQCLKVRSNPHAKNCDCPTYCDATCGCIPCPDCRPGQPCAHCPNDGRCPSCKL